MSRAQPVTVLLTIGRVPCVVEGTTHGTGRAWYTIRSPRTGMELPPELLGLSGWLDVELRAEAAYRGQEPPG